MNDQQLWCLRFLPKLLILAAVLVAPLTVNAQPQSQPQPQTTDPWSGNYKGTAKMESGEMPVTLEIKSANEKFSGRALAGDKEYAIASGKAEGGKLTIKFGPDAATLTLQKVDDKLVGDWISGAQKGTVELKKFVPEVFTAEMLNGEWDAVADAQGQAFPFVLTLKVDGEKVTGTSSSQLGTSSISSGSWKDGKLSVVLEGGAGQITLVAAMIEGKLSGDYDFAGQLSGKWVAIKKK